MKTHFTISLILILVFFTFSESINTTVEVFLNIHFSKEKKISAKEEKEDSKEEKESEGEKEEEDAKHKKSLVCYDLLVSNSHLLTFSNYPNELFLYFPLVHNGIETPPPKLV